MSQSERATTFRNLHQLRPLVLPNAWDAASARLIELAGARAIATTSAAVAWIHGFSDGQELSREAMLATVGEIVAVVQVPVTADVESGYGNGTIADLIETGRMVIDVGAVGVNLEDSPGTNNEPLIAAEIHAERISALRAAVGNDLVINARTDVYLRHVGAPETRFEETVRRTNLYRAAGADCLFIPGVSNSETIAALVRAINGPINILAEAGTPTIGELGQLGVARVSLGPGVAEAAFTTIQRAAREVLEQGTYTSLEGNLSYGAINGMFKR